MLNINIDTNYSNYDGIKYYTYENYLQTPVKELLQSYLDDLDVSKLCKTSKGFVQLFTTTSSRYDELVELYIRFLLKIPYKDFILYNYFVDELFKKHQENIAFEEYFNSTQVSEAKSTKKTKKDKVPNKYVRSETHNLFTGELEYDYTNFATGDSFISSDPNLLEELNVPKKRVKTKKEPRKDFGKIILNFNVK